MPNVIKVHEISGREAGIDADWQRTYTRQWRVVSNEKIGPMRAIIATGMRIGMSYQVDEEGDDGYEVDQFTHITSLTAKEEAGDDARQYLVTATYGPWKPREENPLDTPPDVEWIYTPYERIADEDVDGNAVANSAGDYFDPPATKDDSRPTMIVVRNVANHAPPIADTFRDTVNEAEFYGAPPRTVKCNAIPAKRLYHTTIGYYWQERFEFVWDKEGWDKRVLDQGMRVLGDDGHPHQIILDNALITSPALLDGDGGVLPPGAPPVLLTFQIYPTSDFGLLNLEQPTP